MKTEEKINIRGAVSELKLGDVLELPWVDYRLSSVRSVAYTVAADTDRKYRVTRNHATDLIIVIRTL